jgi:hypothetical protein
VRSRPVLVWRGRPVLCALPARPIHNGDRHRAVLRVRQGKVRTTVRATDGRSRLQCCVLGVACLLTAPGLIVLVLSSGSTSCEFCPVGRAAPLTGLVECDLCTRGKYANDIAQQKCSECEVRLRTLILPASSRGLVSAELASCLMPHASCLVRCVQAGSYLVAPPRGPRHCESCPTGADCK